MVGIQCYPISLKLESPEVVLEEMKKRVGADAALLCVNEVECPEVFNALTLPHQDSRIHFTPNGECCFEPQPGLYPTGGLTPVTVSDPLLRDFDAVGAFVDSSRKQSISSYAWIQTFHIAPLIKKHPEIAMVNIHDRPLTNWACPSNPLVVEYNLSLIENLLSRYELSGIFIDRFRFPSPYDGLDAFFTCFCECCRRRAARMKIDYQRCQDHALAAFDWISSLSVQELQMLDETGYGNGMSMLQSFLGFPGLIDWLVFRQQVITDYVKQVNLLVRQEFPGRKIGLDIWAPSYAWALGQDWKRLEPLVDWIKPILYPLASGPASLAGELVSLVSGCRQLNPSIPTETFLRLLCRVFGFEFADTRTFEEITSAGFPNEVYRVEMRRARVLVGKRKPLYAGCPIIETRPDDIGRRVRAVSETDADGIFYYCYDYAQWENLTVCGEIWKRSHG
ncbi:MAG: hypothetical protein ACWGQW_11755 [bacterium]